MNLIRKLLSFLPQNNLEDPPIFPNDDPIDRLEDSLNEIIPESPNKPYNMYEVIGAIIDKGEFLEVHADYARNIIVGFARFNGQTVGIVANQPKYLAGVLDINASRKGARFVRFCDAFNIPIVSLVDVPDSSGHRTRIRRRNYAWSQVVVCLRRSTVPKITVTLRKAWRSTYRYEL